MLAMLISATILSVLANGLLIRQFGHYARNYRLDMPQRFHAGHVPRYGGAAMMFATAASAFIFAGSSQLHFPTTQGAIAKVLLTCLPIFIAGLLDDITQRVGVRWRLLAGLLSGILATQYLGLTIPRLGIGALDSLWSQWPWLGIGLAVVAIAGLPHAFNIIDGYNGLAGVVAVMILAALAYLALQFGDRALAGLLVCAIGATIGFLFWNYPRGMIFAGDAGAYFWGAVIAVASVALVMRHPQISPWCIMLLLIYPVWETIFSIYRKWARGQSPGAADSMHLHQLIYKRIVRSVFHDSETRRMLMRNNRTSPYLWAFAAMSIIPAALFWFSTPILIFFCLLFVVTYVSAYLMIVRFKRPKWLSARRKPSIKHPH
jgi:UDP-GlcNAc:undecaprenyl-phosphate/decaprenyl-phosphate GlcNAc-1-phosphate transferase